MSIAARPGRDFIIRKAIEPLRNKYDYIVLDTQPDLNSIIINALTAADAVLMPIQANSFYRIWDSNRPGFESQLRTS